MTKPRTYMYRIQYVDNTYQIVDWTKAEFKKVQDQLRADQQIVAMPNETFKANDIRAIVLIPDPPEEVQVEDKSVHDDWGFVDAQTREWLAANGVDLSKGVK